MADQIKHSNSNISSSQSQKITASVVFYQPTNSELRQTAANISRLLRLKKFDFTFYLIDNSTNQMELQQSIFAKFADHVKLIHSHENLGFGRGHNEALPFLHSDYHIVMNPDIEIRDLTGLGNAIDYLNHHDQVSLISPLVRDQSTGQIQYLNRQQPTVFDLLIRFLGPWAFPQRQAWFTKRQTGYDHIQPEVNATGSFMLLRTADFKQVNGFDPRFFMYFEDTDLTQRLLKNGQVMMYPDLTVFHGWKRDDHSLRGMWPIVRSMIQYFNKWGWKWF